MNAVYLQSYASNKNSIDPITFVHNNFPVENFCVLYIKFNGAKQTEEKVDILSSPSSKMHV